MFPLMRAPFPRETRFYTSVMNGTLPGCAFPPVVGYRTCMSIRRKLLLLLLAISIVPLIVVGWHGRRTTRKLGRVLSGRTRETLTELAAARLQRLAESYGDIFREQGDSLDLALRFQAREFEHRLAAPADPAGARHALLARHFDSPDGPPRDAVTLPERYFRIREDGTRTPLPVCLERAAIRLPTHLEPASQTDLVARVADAADLFRAARPKTADILHWQYAGFESGVHVTWPGHGGYPDSYDPRKRSWYRQAVDAGGSIWSTPAVDASTGQVMMTLSTPIRGPDEKIAGVTGADIRLMDVLAEVRVPANWVEGARAHIVSIRPRTEGGGSELAVVAQRDYLDEKSRWDRPIDVATIHRKDPAFEGMLVDIAEGGSGVAAMRWRGHDCLWGYGAINTEGTSFLVIVPTDLVVAEAERAEEEVLSETQRQLLATGAIFLVVMFLIVLAAHLGARAVTRPVLALTKAAGQIADGDLDTRADVRSGDELETLAHAFNAMVPHLRERMEIRDSLLLARKVQQHLLPAAPPDIDGLDIAGVSLYCDETGGDYYDYMDLSNQAPDRVGIVIGDVSGHGIASALFMAGARATMRTRATREEGPARLVSEVNRRLAADSTDGRYMTLFWVVVDTPVRAIRWVNAGHHPGLLYDPLSDVFEELGGDGIPLGIDSDWAYRASGRTDLSAGQVLILGTDGIQETRDEGGRMFGEEGIRALIREHAHRSAEEIVGRVTGALAEYRGTVRQQDDVTLVVVRFG